MKKLYEEPKMMVNRFEMNDVITMGTSVDGYEPGIGDWEPESTM